MDTYTKYEELRSEIISRDDPWDSEGFARMAHKVVSIDECFDSTDPCNIEWADELIKLLEERQLELLGYSVGVDICNHYEDRHRA